MQSRSINLIYISLILPTRTDGVSNTDTYLSVVDLLAELGEKCLYRLEMYWSYELCFRKHLRQYHEDVMVTKDGTKQKKVSEHFLGRTAKAKKALSVVGNEAKIDSFVYKGTPYPHKFAYIYAPVLHACPCLWTYIRTAHICICVCVPRCLVQVFVLTM